MSHNNDNDADAAATDTSKPSMDLAKEEFRTILENIDELNLSERIWQLHRTRMRLRRKRRLRRLFERPLTSLEKIFLFVIATCIIPLICAVVVKRTVTDKCLITTPSVMQKVFRPPESCSICRDVQQVDKLAAVDPAIFEQRYAYSGEPVVITDAMMNWTAPEVFSFAFFKKLYHGEKMSSGHCQFFPYKTEFQSLQDVFEISDDRASMEKGAKPWYVGWSNCDDEIGAILREHYQKPYFLPATAETKKTDWIFMGSRGYGAPMHVDNVDHPSWQAQIKGEKLWILEPPRECHYVCKQLTVTVHPGEIIVLDTNRWYHQTKIVSEDISITIGAEYD
ncbi:hypothetical protein DMN91_006754 [Ooceraea biroi]|uniref:Cupin-like domain-containing protein n=1 Tax=Ooceraea biroi TaxID=2015173 RepID=A0A026X3R8_OOCBI|nr:uncharacterized protein LOC105288160 [Ooceraea biroi]EZA62728.1 hypothetical protein X777_07543 [Ooceraea biroi]RLU20148.1 hypothetical protein DMN91_006754 [Ooceraea biroi]